MCPVNYGKEGIRQRDWRVWGINANDESYQTALGLIQDLFEDYDAEDFADAYAHFNTNLKAVLTHLGEMRRDSINSSIDDGDSIEGNEVGKLSLSKNCKFEAELINATSDNINALLDWDGLQGVIILEEITSGRLANVGGAMLDARELVIIGNVAGICAGETDGVAGNIAISEKYPGSGIAVCNISIERKCPVASNFRKIIDLYSEDCLPTVVQYDPGLDVNEVYTAKWEYAQGYSPITEYALLEVATDALFENIVYSNSALAEKYVIDDVTLAAGTYYSRIRLTVGGVPKSKYSNIKFGDVTASQ